MDSKIFYRGILLFALLTLFLSHSASALSLSVGSATADPGQTGISIDVEVDDATGIAGGDLTLSYDADALKAVRAVASTMVAGAGIIAIPNLNTAGEVKISLAGAAGIPSGSGTLLTITFDALSNATPGEYALTLTRTALRDELAGLLTVSGKTAGKITITGVSTPDPGTGTPGTDPGDSGTGDPDTPVGIRLEVTSATAEPGATGITVSIDIDNAAGIAGGDLTLTYDSAAMTATQAVASAMVAGAGIIAIPNLITPGEVKISLAGAAGIASGSGTLLTITFDIKSEAADGTYDLTLTRASLRNELAKPITAEITPGGKITVSGGGG